MKNKKEIIQEILDLIDKVKENIKTTHSENANSDIYGKYDVLSILNDLKINIERKYKV